MSNMSLRAHLIELQRRLKISLLFFGVGLVIAFIFRHPLLTFVRAPHQWAMSKLNLASTVYVFRYQDNFIAQIKVCIVAGFIFAFPFILFQIFKFIQPGLLPRERKMLFGMYMPALLALFLCGAAFSYTLLIPYGLHFLILFGTQAGLFPLISFTDYISLFVILMLMSALIFELPVIMVLMTSMGFVSAHSFKKNRRYAILMSVVMAAILTPPDPVTQLFMAVPLVVLYEVGAVLATLVEKRKSPDLIDA